MCHENGLDIAVEAFILLKKQPGFEDVRLCITGGSTSADSGYIARIKKMIRKAHLGNHVEFHEEFEGAGRKEFFKKVAIASVPVRNGEAFGIYLPELMASGIPIIQPDLGAFSEIVNQSGGGRIYTPNTPEILAKNWSEVLTDKNLMSEWSVQARKGVEQHFDIYVHTEKIIQIYQKLLDESVNMGKQSQIE
jgi:glycosyltransferase involved in cell wall biosynthesis